LKFLIYFTGKNFQFLSVWKISADKNLVTYKLAELKTKIAKRKPLQVITRVGKDEVLVHSSNLKIKVSHTQRAERHIRAGAMLETLGFDKTTVLDIPLISNQLKQHRKRKYAKAYNQFKRTAKKRVNQHIKDKYAYITFVVVGYLTTNGRFFASHLCDSLITNYYIVKTIPNVH